jgi:hypothetical protein
MTKPPPDHLIQILGLADGRPSPFDGQYLKQYDPGRDGVDPNGERMLAHIVCTDDPAEAIQFSDLEEIHALWTAVDPRCPLRPDGKPNRPLTAFSITIGQLPMDRVDGFRCPHCGMVSHNPNDIAEGYCGNCHDWTGGEDG